MNLESPSLFSGYLAQLALIFGRYLLMAGGAYLLFWVLLRNRVAHKRIQKRRPDSRQLLSEFKWSVVTSLIFALNGVGIFFLIRSGITPFYTDFAERGGPYFLLSVAAVILFHDAYFYFTHRALHHPWIFKRVHALHHRSLNPTPWAAYSFHPLEAAVQAGVLPIAVLLIPLHPMALFTFILYTMVLNVLGHLGYEFFPKGFTRGRWTWWHNSSTHHNLHHQFFSCNYGLYFNFWDRLLGTNHARYHEKFDEVAGPRGP